LADSPIDVWDAKTFDPELMRRLAPHADLVVDYFARDHAIFLAHELGRGPGRALLRPENEYADAFQALREAIGRAMAVRTLRAWHYTRLTDAEVAGLRRDGVRLSTPQTLQARFAALVAAGELTEAQAQALFAASPFHSDQLDARSGKFWMTSHPVAVDDGGVQPLLAHWGGEVASMWVRDEALLTALARIGRPRILEVAVPVDSTCHAYAAGEAVVATFARAQGAIPSKQAFDLYVREPLPGAAVQVVHTEGEPGYWSTGRGHPAAFVDIDLGRWRELTGEDD
jgi:hypothetical protein